MVTPGGAAGRALVHRRAGLLPLPLAALDAVDAPASAAEVDYMAAFARFLSRNVAAGSSPVRRTDDTMDGIVVLVHGVVV